MKTKNSRFQRKKSNEFSLGAAIETWLEQNSLKDGLRFEQVRSGWPQIVGPVIAARTEALWMVGDVLYVRMQSPQWKQEVSFARDRIRHEVNQFVNHPLCSEVQVR